MVIYHGLLNAKVQPNGWQKRGLAIGWWVEIRQTCAKRVQACFILLKPKNVTYRETVCIVRVHVSVKVCICVCNGKSGRLSWKKGQVMEVKERCGDQWWSTIWLRRAHEMFWMARIVLAGSNAHLALVSLYEEAPCLCRRLRHCPWTAQMTIAKQWPSFLKGICVQLYSAEISIWIYYHLLSF